LSELLYPYCILVDSFRGDIGKPFRLGTIFK
jgi:hypothetical protein